MENFQGMQRLTELIYKHRLPTTQTIFLDIVSYNKAQQWLKNFGSSAVQSVKLEGANPELQVDQVVYGNCTFNIICY